MVFFLSLSASLSESEDEPLVEPELLLDVLELERSIATDFLLSAGFLDDGGVGAATTGGAVSLVSTIFDVDGIEEVPRPLICSAAFFAACR